jgi:hypothetical protein
MQLRARKVIVPSVAVPHVAHNGMRRSRQMPADLMMSTRGGASKQERISSARVGAHGMRKLNLRYSLEFCFGFELNFWIALRRQRSIDREIFLSETSNHAKIALLNPAFAKVFVQATGGFVA